MQVANVNVYIAFIPPSQPILKQIQNVRGCLKGIIAFNHNSAILKPQFSFTACNVVVIRDFVAVHLLSTLSDRSS